MLQQLDDEDDVDNSRVVQIGILDGGAIPCDNSVYPALYNRVAAPDNYEWILNFIQGNFCLE